MLNLKRKKINKYILCFGSIFMMFLLTTIFPVLNRNEKNTIVTNAAIENIESLSNKKIGWGIKRADNHAQPDVGAKNKEILDKYEGYCLGNNISKKIYLTFDAGYEAGYTEKILEVLKQNDVKACFFITAHYVNTKPELVQKMIDEGHIIGNHTVNHKSMPDINLETIKKEVMDLHTSIYQKFGYEMKYIRPPKGEYSERTVAYTNTLGYKTGKDKILNNVHNGEIMLLHSTSKDNANILDECIKEIKKMSYEFKSLDEFEK